MEGIKPLIRHYSKKDIIESIEKLYDEDVIDEGEEVTFKKLADVWEQLEKEVKDMENSRKIERENSVNGLDVNDKDLPSLHTLDISEVEVKVMW